MNWRLMGIVAVWLLAAAIIYTIIKKFGGDFFWDASIWQVIAAIAMWLLVLGVVFAFIQIREARKSNNAQLTVDLYWKFRDDKAVRELRSIYRLKPEDFNNLGEYRKEAIDHVLGWFDTVGALVIKKVATQQLATELMGDRALRLWYKLCEYIRGEREKRGCYAENYEAFTRLCLDHFKQEGVQVKPYGEENKELVFEELQKDELKPRSFKEIERDRKKNKPKS